MQQIVSARSITAGALFYSSMFSIPDYQRRYKWGRDEVGEFLQDIKHSVDTGNEYFLGLLITTESPQREEVVDGQQRLITLTLLVNCLRIEAIEIGREATATNLEQTYLYCFDEEDERWIPRLELADAEDKRILQSVLSLGPGENLGDKSSNIASAHMRISRFLRETINSAPNEGACVAQWTKWIRERLSFVWFRHPDAASAFSVFMVVNTRGLDLTASELVKAYLMSVDAKGRVEIAARWTHIEEALCAVGGSMGDAMTGYVRHVYLLGHGYIINKYLFEAVSSAYTTPSQVKGLMSALDDNLDSYLVMLDPFGAECDDEAFASAASVFCLLGIRTVRPLLLAMRRSETDAATLSEFVGAVIAKWVVGSISSNVDEVSMAAAALEIERDRTRVKEVVHSLSSEFRPPRADFEEAGMKKRVAQRKHAEALLACSQQKSALPDRANLAKSPRRMFPADAFDDGVEPYYSLIGNWTFGQGGAGSYSADDVPKLTRSIVSALAEAIYGV